MTLSLSNYLELLNTKTAQRKKLKRSEKELKDSLCLIDDYIRSEKKREEVSSELKNHIEYIKKNEKSERLQNCIDELSVLYLLVQSENKDRLL